MRERSIGFGNIFLDDNFSMMRCYKNLISVHPKQAKDFMILRKVAATLMCYGLWFFSGNTQ